ncbi:unnamed protein product [Porites lobata]|uniref:Uncharacterized protein n=1 Tax=Porites lobata TaxID=104759 RepID=A0ABN8R8H2_9CNID|nr:unnamed protein product [Porites lobata]
MAQKLSNAYVDPSQPGSLGGVAKFAKAHGLAQSKARQVLETMLSTFYEEDVQKVVLPDEALFRVEKVLKRKGNQVFVAWKG